MTGRRTGGSNGRIRPGGLKRLRSPSADRDGRVVYTQNQLALARLA